MVCRYQKVAYLDTDVGQTEFTPPGFLSLTVIDQLTPGTHIQPSQQSGQHTASIKKFPEFLFTVAWFSLLCFLIIL